MEAVMIPGALTITRAEAEAEAHRIFAPMWESFVNSKDRPAGPPQEATRRSLEHTFTVGFLSGISYVEDQQSKLVDDLVQQIVTATQSGGRA